MMRSLFRFPCVAAATLALLPTAALAQAAPAAAPVNWHAVVMFLVFIALTLYITYWAAKRTKTATDFYAAGRGISALQNGLAIAGDYMSAASFLGIAALVYFNGFYGLNYSVGWLVGWPIVLFLIAERLRNLGKYTFADVAAYRAAARADPRDGRAQHPGGGDLLPDRPDGRRRPAAAHPAAADRILAVDHHRRRADHHLRHLRRHEGDDLGADHQGGAAAGRRDPAGAAGAGAFQLQPRCPVRRGGAHPSEPRRHHEVDGADRRQARTRSRRSRSA